MATTTTKEVTMTTNTASKTEREIDRLEELLDSGRLREMFLNPDEGPAFAFGYLKAAIANLIRVHRVENGD
jgi:hypothetical protein